MKKTNTLHIILELVTIFSYIFIGITVLTFVSYPDVDIHNKSFIGSIILAIGTSELVQFLSLNYLRKLRNIPNSVAAVATMILGFLVMVLPIELKTVCVVWGICWICFQIIKIVNASYNVMKQPFLNIFIIILSVVGIVYSIILIANNTTALINHFTFIGVYLLIEAFILIVEFIIHRYQK